MRQTLEQAGICGEDGGAIDHIELFGDDPQADSRSFVLCPGKAYDRSPCGTGTSAKLACLAAEGKLPPDTQWRQASVIGSEFQAYYRRNGDRITPLFAGRPMCAPIANCCSTNAILCLGNTLMGVGRKADVIVIGAGIIGAACARRLAREGYRVSVVDDRRAGATAAGMGHLVCMDDNPAELALSAYSLRLWREVTGCMPQACALRGCGTLWLADKVDEMAIAEQNGRGWRSWG